MPYMSPGECTRAHTHSIPRANKLEKVDKTKFNQVFKCKALRTSNMSMCILKRKRAFSGSPKLL